MITEPNLTGLQTTMRQVRDKIEDQSVIMDYQEVQRAFEGAAAVMDNLYRAVRISKLHLAREDATSRIRDIDRELGEMGLTGQQVAVDWC